MAFKNLSGWFNHMDKVKHQVPDAVTDALRRAARGIVDDMQSRAPVDTGTLRDSISFREDEGSITIIAKAEHAAFVEYGTIHMREQPFFHPTMDEWRSKIVDYVVAELNKRGLT